MILPLPREKPVFWAKINSHRGSPDHQLLNFLLDFVVMKIFLNAFNYVSYLVKYLKDLYVKIEEKYSKLNEKYILFKEVLV